MLFVSSVTKNWVDGLTLDREILQYQELNIFKKNNKLFQLEVGILQK